MSAAATSHACLEADASASVLASLIENRQACVYARIGDGDVYCAFALPPYGNGEQANTNGEVASPGLPLRIRRAIARIAHLPGYVYWGDYLSRSVDEPELGREWEQMRPWLMRRPLLHVEALLLHRRSDALRAFYAAAADDRRRKVYVAPAALAQGAELLGADHYEVPASNAYERAEEIAAELDEERWQVVYLSAGYASKLIVAEGWRAGRSYIDLGSALDPLYRSESTRTGQLTQAEARALLGELM